MNFNEVKLVSFLKPHKAQLLVGLSALDRDKGISRDFMISPPYRAPILPLTPSSIFSLFANKYGSNERYN
jgi:hypothetical protein